MIKAYKLSENVIQSVKIVRRSFMALDGIVVAVWQKSYRKISQMHVWARSHSLRRMSCFLLWKVKTVRNVCFCLPVHLCRWYILPEQINQARWQHQISVCCFESMWLMDGLLQSRSSDMERILVIRNWTFGWSWGSQTQEHDHWLMGKHSNIIFCDENDMILDSIKHISAQVSSVREVLPGRTYLYLLSRIKWILWKKMGAFYGTWPCRNHDSASKAIYTS